MISKGAATRDRILDLALAEASRLGFEGLSLGPLAEQAKMSKSGLFAHFASKEDLQLAVLKRAIDRFVARVVAPALKAPRGEPRVRAMFERWLTWADDPGLPGGCPFIAAANELDDRPGPLRDALVASQRDWLGALATAADLAVGEGHFRRQLDTVQFAYELYSILLAAHHFRRLLNDPEAGPRALVAFDRLVAEARSVH